MSFVTRLGHRYRFSTRALIHPRWQARHRTAETPAFFELGSPLPHSSPTSGRSVQNPPHHQMKGWNFLWRKPLTKVLVAMIAITAISFSPFLLSNSNDLQITDGLLFIIEDFPDDSDGVSFFYGCPVGMVQLICAPQIVIVGRVSHFDWSQTDKLSVLWNVFGCGSYMSQSDDAYPNQVLPPNKAVDVYINRWVQIRLLFNPEVAQ